MSRDGEEPVDLERRVRTARGPLSRGLITVGLLTMSVVLSFVVFSSANDLLFRGGEEWGGRGASLMLSDVLSFVSLRIVVVLAIGVLSRMASYRIRDLFIGFIPFLGDLLLVRLCWRAALYPYLDWRPRQEEVGSSLEKEAVVDGGRVLWRRKP